MTDKPTPIPSGFLNGVLSEFGLQWTHLVIFSGYLFSAIGLDEYLNGNLWLLISISAFVIVFAFRRQVSPKFPRIALLAVIFLAASLLVPYFAIEDLRADPASFIQMRRNVATTYASAISITLLAIAIISYRKQEDEAGLDYPPELKRVLLETSSKQNFYKRSQRYLITILEVTPTGFRARVRLQYVLVNRASKPESVSLSLTPTGDHFTVSRAEIADNSVMRNPDVRTQLGLIVNHTFDAGSETAVLLEGEITYGANGADLFTSYIPTTDFQLEIDQRAAPDLELWVRTLSDEQVTPSQPQRDVERYILKNPTIPYQGFVVRWGRRLSTEPKLSDPRSADD